MNDAVLRHFAERLSKCPCCGEVFESQLSLRLHLCESHKTEICRSHRIQCPTAFKGIERPSKLRFCGHCLEANSPEPFASDAFGKIDNHIRVEHSHPSSPTRLTFSVSEDSTLIDKFMDEQGFHEVRACSRCGEIFDDDASVALHWAERYCEAPSIEEARRAFEADPERFRAVLAESLVETAEEEARQRLAAHEPDDGYIIHHCPNVPRVRSRPSEHIVEKNKPQRERRGV